MQVLTFTPAHSVRPPRRPLQVAAVKPGSGLTRSELQRIVAEMLD